MANESSLLEVSSEEDERIELSLGLSIGGSLRKSDKAKNEEHKAANSCGKIESEGSNVDGCWRPEGQGGSEYLDPQRKREIHAMRRQEARRKREGKLRKAVNGGFGEDKMWMEAQRLQIRVRDREMREKEARIQEHACNRDKSQVAGGNSAVVNEEVKEAAHGSSPPGIPVAPLQYPYPSLQYVQLGNGFAYPCVMPCWAPALGSVGNEKNTEQPAACRSFHTYQVSPSSGIVSDSERNSVRDGGNRNTVSNMSPVCSSSVVSDHRSTSPQGGSSTDTGSRSSHCKPERSEQLGQSEHSVSSNQVESSTKTNNAKATNHDEKPVLSSTIQTSPTKVTKEINSKTQPNTIKLPITSQNPKASPTESGSQGSSKPPKPETPSPNTPPFSKMPCVSTTGNGPNGKTITGFLYRYTKAEVSIICVCHGSSFSPAEFVEHAGGKDIANPLKHITVIPSAFG
ncbi:uncharacterized protein LOC127796279 [Diospyros lotus]|uniref:uncharacterized protein LOC127796279 n=1 Tax=Diospyros lotus TaxID=55363 RepID=UPI00225591B7|nr:uncharacterized protein LOC127796279 [Diospyros lotus]